MTKLEELVMLIDEKGDGKECYSCQYFLEINESHPYGMGTAAEALWECMADTEQEASECPRI